MPLDGGAIAALFAGLALGLGLSFAVGLAVGFFSGLLGIGGGTMLVPAFKLGFAMDAIASTATSLFTIIPTSLAGFVTHMRNRTCIPKLGCAAGFAGALTSPLGVWLASRSQDWMIMLAAALIIGYTACSMLRKALRMPKGSGEEGAQVKEAPGSLAAGVQPGAQPEARPEAQAAPAPFAFPAVTRKMVGQAALIGMAAGLASGYVGVGGGFLMVPLFMRILGTPMRLTSGTSLIAVMILALPGVAYQGWLGNVDWLAGIAVAAGSVPGAALGARFVTRVDERALRLIFGAFLLFAAFMLVVNQLAPTG